MAVAAQPGRGAERPAISNWPNSGRAGHEQWPNQATIETCVASARKTVVDARIASPDQIAKIQTKPPCGLTGVAEVQAFGSTDAGTCVGERELAARGTTPQRGANTVGRDNLVKPPSED